MTLKYSSALLTAMFAIATPVLAQDTTAPAAEQPVVPNTLPESMDSAAQSAAQSVNEAAQGATDAVNEATGQMSPSTAATTDEAAAGTDAETGAAEMTSDSAPADTDTPATTDAAAGSAMPAPDAPAETMPAETTDEQPEAPTDAAPAATADAPAADAEPQVGSYYVKATHADWTLRCIRSDRGEDPCELYQLLQDASGNSVAEVTMIPLGGNEVALGATVVAPLETDLIYGLHMQVDTGAESVYPFNFCAPVGCVSRMGFTAAELSGLKRGSASTVKLLPFGGAEDSPVELAMSLSGFTAAFTELEAIAAEARAAAPAPAAPAAAAEAPAEAAPAN